MNYSRQDHSIGLYIRVSTEEQAANPEGSIRNQEDRLRQQVAGGGLGEIKGLPGSGVGEHDAVEADLDFNNRDARFGALLKLRRLHTA